MLNYDPNPLKTEPNVLWNLNMKVLNSRVNCYIANTIEHNDSIIYSYDYNSTICQETIYILKFH